MKHVLITGAGSGLGKALALRYAAAGAEIAISDLNAETGQQVTQLINDAGGAAFFIQCDITQQWGVEKMALQIAERWRSVDVLINNAGVATAGQFESESMEQWEWVMDINLLGHVRVTKSILPLLRLSVSANRAIINIASQAGLTPAPGMGSYSVTKAAMISLSETMNLELAQEGIHVAAVCPAFFDTNLNKSLRTKEPKMQTLINKMVKDSGIGASEIADIVFEEVAHRKFLVITHKRGVTAYRLKRFLPIDRYLAMIKKRSKKYLGSEPVTPKN